MAVYACIYLWLRRSNFLLNILFVLTATSDKKKKNKTKKQKTKQPPTKKPKKKELVNEESTYTKEDLLIALKEIWKHFD